MILDLKIKTFTPECGVEMKVLVQFCQECSKTVTKKVTLTELLCVVNF